MSSISPNLLWELQHVQVKVLKGCVSWLSMCPGMPVSWHLMMIDSLLTSLSITSWWWQCVSVSACLHFASLHPLPECRREDMCFTIMLHVIGQSHWGSDISVTGPLGHNIQNSLSHMKYIYFGGSCFELLSWATKFPFCDWTFKRNNWVFCIVKIHTNKD